MEIHAAPIQILMDANWQMMAMLNILLITAGACLMYHTEYADNAIQRMCTLPIKESKLFFGKVTLMVLMCIVILVIEAASIAFCSYHWFELSHEVWIEVIKSFKYALLLMLPSTFGSLFIASACKNMWVSLGIRVVGTLERKITGEVPGCITTFQTFNEGSIDLGPHYFYAYLQPELSEYDAWFNVKDDLLVLGVSAKDTDKISHYYERFIA